VDDDDALRASLAEHFSRRTEFDLTKPGARTFGGAFQSEGGI
jgi:hypothetical protein